eukprot:8905784-Pyramimonas_sp.AAC.1
MYPSTCYRYACCYRGYLRRITVAPLPFGSAHVAERWGQSSAKLADHVFTQPCEHALGNT